jgi:hypothetical protein
MGTVCCGTFFARIGAIVMWGTFFAGDEMSMIYGSLGLGVYLCV